MSLRLESIRAYRELYRAAATAAQGCSLHNGPGLLHYVSQRYGQEAELHHRQLSQALKSLERSGGNKKVQRPSASAARQRSRILQQYQKYISNEIDRTRANSQAFFTAPENAELRSILQVLSAGIGNTAFQQMMESNFLTFLEFEEKRASRDEAAEDTTSERQNRIMQQALLPYVERLLLVHRTAIGELNRESNLAYLTPWQVTDAIVGNRSGVSAIHLRVGRDHIVVEVDETYNKQVVYVASTRRDGGNSGSYEWSQDVERVEISESEEVQKTMFHSEYLFAASRICDTLLHDSPLHPTRSTVIIGHGVGGAVGVALSLLLVQRGFEMSNTISLGAPKVLQGTLDRYITAVNPIRIVLAGDPLVELPVTGAEGAPFVQIGEILLLTPHGTAGAEAAPLPQEDEPLASTTPALSREHNEPVFDDSRFTADSLGSMLNEDERGTSAALGDSEASPSYDKKDSFGDRIVDSESTSSEDDEERLAETQRMIEAEYGRQFLVEDYVHHMRNPAVELTYAEGDEVWDSGDYDAMKRTSQREPIVTAEEHRVRDLRGPL